MTENPSSNLSRQLLLAGKILLGLGLAIILVLIFSFRENDAGGGFMDPPKGEETVAGAPGTWTPDPSLTAFEQAKANKSYLAVQGVVDPVKVLAEPREGAQELKSFPLRGQVGETITFWVQDEKADATGAIWYRVQMPARPNGSTGWVRGYEVQPVEIPYHLLIDLSDYRLSVFEKGTKIKEYPIGLGRVETPTPLGQYYVSVKSRPENPNTVYGVLIMGVSAFSEKLTDWPGGGQVGIHGTNDPEGSIGKNVSAGCIRLRNEDILDVNNYAPLGTPVFIQQ